MTVGFVGALADSGIVPSAIEPRWTVGGMDGERTAQAWRRRGAILTTFRLERRQVAPADRSAVFAIFKPGRPSPP